jgi:selenocysteine-specific elongation factor
MLIRGGLVVGTAGKTALVYALTGMNTDTLQEEKKRGISIDLGFAHLSLPGYPLISFIDVPGHERFIKNMLAGVAGIQAVLLIVAANESVKPQTSEHFDICRLLGIRQGAIVLTKTDLATPSQIETARSDVKLLVANSFLQEAPILCVSALTGEGIESLQQLLCEMSSRQSHAKGEGLFRLAVDRSFARKGFGAVVTGTLASGSLSVGDAVHIYPQKLAARVRGLQVHHSPVDSVSAGQRVAINLAGVEHAAIHRGNTIAPPNLLATTRVADVSIEWLNPRDAPAHRQDVVFHAGTSEVMATVKMNAPLSEATLPLAHLRLSEPVLLLPGDRFVLRQPSPAGTIAGGSVLDPFPPRRISRIKAAGRLNALSVAFGLAARIKILVAESPRGLAVSDLVRMTGTAAPEIKSAVELQPDLMITTSGVVLTRHWIENMRLSLTKWLQEFHTQNPGASGAPLSLARMGLDASLTEAVFSGFAAIRVQGDLVALNTHRAAFSDADTQLMQRIEEILRSAAYQPPSPAEVLQQSAGGKRAAQLLEILIKSQRLVRISNDLIFHADVITHIRNSLAQHKGRRFSVAEFKSWMNISRKYAIPLLEYLDNHRVTRREGDMRIVI